MSDAMTCEIVESVALGKTFRYCRTHKTEDKDCPKPGVEFDRGNALERRTKHITATEVLKRMNDRVTPPFKIGDTVKVKNCGVHTQFLGCRGIITCVYPVGSRYYIDGTKNVEALYLMDTIPNVVWALDNLERV